MVGRWRVAGSRVGAGIGLALPFLTISCWYLFGGKISLVVLALSFLTAIVLLRVATHLPLDRQKLQWLIVGLGIFPALHFVSSLDSFHDEYFNAHRERRADLAEIVKIPGIFPQIFFQGVPQRYHFYDPDSKSIDIRVGGLSFETIPLGSGLFMADISLDHKFPSAKDGKVDIALVTDTEERELRVPLVTTWARPQTMKSSASSGLAVTVCKTTDEGFLFTRELGQKRFATGDGPTGCGFADAEGTLLAVSHAYGDGLHFYDLRSNDFLKKIELAGRLGDLDVAPDYSRLVVLKEGDTPGFYTLDQDFEQAGFTPLPDSPEWICFGRDRDEIIITSRKGLCLWVLCNVGGDWQIEHEQKLARPFVFLKRGADGEVVSGGASLADLTTDDLGGNHRIVNSVVHFSLGDLDFIRPWITEGRSSAQAKPGSYDLGISPMGMCQTDEGVLISFSGTSEVIRYTPDGIMEKRIDLREHGLRAGHAIASLGGGRWAVASPAEGAVGIFDSADRILRRFDLNPPDPFDASNSAERIIDRRFGEIAFYEATLAGISCQSCHTHGDSDYASHDIGGGRPVATLSAMGVVGTAPYLRDGSYPSLASLHEVAKELYRGYAATEEEGLREKQIAEYLATNPSNFRSGGADLGGEELVKVRKGSEVFFDSKCVQCHQPPAFTNLSSVPANRLFPGRSTSSKEILDTPSLLNVGGSAPYLHDGRARALEDVIGKENRGNIHGDTRGLQTEEVSALVTFLKSL